MLLINTIQTFSISGKQDAFQPVSNCGPEIFVFQFPMYLDNFWIYIPDFESELDPW